MLVGLGGLAQGIAEGMNMGMQWRNQQQYLDLQKQYQDRQAKADDRDAEVHAARMDQYASEKDIRDRRQRAMQQIADYTNHALNGGNQPGTMPAMQDPNAPPQPQAAMPPPPLAGAMPQSGLSMNAPTPMNPGAAAGLAPAAPVAPQMQQQPQQPAMPPSKVLEKGMVTGAYTPEMLTNISKIFAQNGLHDEGIKYMEQAYTAQKRGVTQAAMAFMQNNPGSAMQALKAGGVQLESAPTKIKPNDPNDHNWKINISGQGEQTINVKDWLQSTMDPDKFFEIEDKKRKADLESIKTNNDTRKTNAEIGYLKSRSSLADANADKADRYAPGGLKSSGSSEAQINSALSRRDKAYDRITSVKNDEGKFEVDPGKRQALDTASNQYQTFLEDQRGEELNAREHQKFTDVMTTYPIGGTPAQIKQWQQTQFLPRFGGKTAKQEPQAASQPAAVSSQQPATPAPAQPSGPAPGSLASLKQKAKAREAVNNEMAAVQQALKSPNLNVQQKQALSMKAQEIAVRRDALK